MRTVIGGKEIFLSPKEVEAAKKIVGDFLHSVKTKSEEYQNPTFYFTTLIMMHYMSKNQLDAITPETLQKIINSVNHIK